MRKGLAAIVVLLFWVISTLSNANPLDDFMAEIKTAPGVINVFREGLTIWVQVPGSSDFQSRGQELADMFAAWHRNKIGGLTPCFRVFYGDRRTVGNSCR